MKVGVILFSTLFSGWLLCLFGCILFRNSTAGKEVPLRHSFMS